jgi:hypothetical protein
VSEPRWRDDAISEQVDQWYVQAEQRLAEAWAAENYPLAERWGQLAGWIARAGNQLCWSDKADA